MKPCKMRKVLADHLKTLMDNAEFAAWFNARPACVQAVIRQRPPGIEYTVHGGPFPGLIRSYQQADDGGVTLLVDIQSPFMPRTVFGLKVENLQIFTREPLPPRPAFGEEGCTWRVRRGLREAL